GPEAMRSFVAPSCRLTTTQSSGVGETWQRALVAFRRVMGATWEYPGLGGVVRVGAGAGAVDVGAAGEVVVLVGGSDVLCAPLHPSAKAATARRKVALVIAGTARRALM